MSCVWPHKSLSDWMLAERMGSGSYRGVVAQGIAGVVEDGHIVGQQELGVERGLLEEVGGGGVGVIYAVVGVGPDAFVEGVVAGDVVEGHRFPETLDKPEVGILGVFVKIIYLQGNKNPVR